MQMHKNSAGVVGGGEKSQASRFLDRPHISFIKKNPVELKVKGKS
ncbi:hypothetical protein [Acinetobacter pittii]|nr:hypothetical protein [Acinetobacter pittii]